VTIFDEVERVNSSYIVPPPNTSTDPPQLRCTSCTAVSIPKMWLTLLRARQVDIAPPHLQFVTDTSALDLSPFSKGLPTFDIFEEPVLSSLPLAWFIFYFVDAGAKPVPRWDGLSFSREKGQSGNSLSSPGSPCRRSRRLKSRSHQFTYDDFSKGDCGITPRGAFENHLSRLVGGRGDDDLTLDGFGVTVLSLRIEVRLALSTCYRSSF
jgi:hypothetical protein